MAPKKGEVKIDDEPVGEFKKSVPGSIGYTPGSEFAAAAPGDRALQYANSANAATATAPKPKIPEQDVLADLGIGYSKGELTPEEVAAKEAAEREAKNAARPGTEKFREIKEAITGSGKTTTIEFGEDDTEANERKNAVDQDSLIAAAITNWPDLADKVGVIAKVDFDPKKGMLIVKGNNGKIASINDQGQFVN